MPQFFLVGLRPSPSSTLFPYTTLFRSSLDSSPLMVSLVQSASNLPLLMFAVRSEEHTSELQSRREHVCRLLLEKKNHLLMEAKHWGLRKSRNATSLNSRFKSLDTLKVKIISVTFRRVIRTNHKKASKIWRHENIQLGGCQS